jgi:uncharacterized protein YwqG
MKSLLNRSIRCMQSKHAVQHPVHQLLGYPCQIQGDLLQECQRDTQYEGDPTDWRLLLQIDSDSNGHMMWGDVGMLYFSISKKALLSQDFSQVHLLMQCS